MGPKVLVMHPFLIRGQGHFVPARWPHLGFREVPLASPFLASASSCSSSSPSADSTWEKRLVAVSRALVCGEREGVPENKWGSDY